MSASGVIVNMLMFFPQSVVYFKLLELALACSPSVPQPSPLCGTRTSFYPGFFCYYFENADDPSFALVENEKEREKEGERAVLLSCAQDEAVRLVK